MFAQLNGLLRQLLREKEGRDAQPSAWVIDAQSVKTSTSVPASSQGIDAGKKTVGRKRSIVTDTLGLLPQCWSLPALPSGSAAAWNRSRWAKVRSAPQWSVPRPDPWGTPPRAITCFTPRARAMRRHLSWS